jgi:hypothetical protein
MQPPSPLPGTDGEEGPAQWADATECVAINVVPAIRPVVLSLNPPMILGKRRD